MKKIVLVLAIIAIFLEFYFFFFSVNKIPTIKYVDRQTGEIKTERIIAEKGLKWLYYDPLGKLTLNSLIKRKFISKYYGKLMDKPASRKKIIPFIKKLDLSIPSDLGKYHTFNEFFIRKIPDLDLHLNKDSLIIVSPACGKIIGFENLEERDKFFIKGIRFSLSEFLNNNKLFINPTIIIIRLTPADYHRFYFPYDCKIIKTYSLGNYLYSVSPLALIENAKIFLENKRTITICENKELGKFVIAEVGATFIGSIIQTFKAKNVKKGDEKGYFKFGGSSIVLIFPANKVKIDEDILQNTGKGYETTVYAGERIGKVVRR